MAFEVNDKGEAQFLPIPEEPDSSLRVALDYISDSIRCTLDCVSNTFVEMRKKTEDFEVLQACLNERIEDILELCTDDVREDLTEHEKRQIKILETGDKSDFGGRVTVLADFLTYLESRRNFDVNTVAFKEKKNVEIYRRILTHYLVALERLKKDPNLKNLFEVKTIVTAYLNLRIKGGKMDLLAERFDEFFAHNFFLLGIEQNRHIDLEPISQLMIDVGILINEMRVRDFDLN